MNFLYLSFIAIAGLMLTLSSQSLANEPIHKISLNDFHLKTLAEDGPIVDLAFDHTREGLWLLGKKALWHWNYVEQRLQRYQLRDSTSPTSQLNAQRLISLDIQPYLAVTAGSRLFLVGHNPFKVTEFQIPESQGGEGYTVAVLLNSEQTCCLWAHSQGVFEISPEHKKVDKLSAFAQTSGKRHSAVNWYHQIWSITDSELMALDLFTGEERLIYTSKEPILGVHIGQKQDIILITNQALLRMQASGQIIQIIPQRHNEPLAAAHFDSYTHTYLFQDGLLERYHMPFRHLESHDLAAESQANFGRTVVSGPFIATVRDNVPSVFIIGTPVINTPVINTP